MIDHSSHSQIAIVLTTESDFSKATKLADLLLEHKLAACISLSQISSIYWWKGKIENGNEVQLMIKTTRVKLDSLKDFICKMHSYENPELLSWMANSSKSYLRWATTTLSGM